MAELLLLRAPAFGAALWRSLRSWWRLLQARRQGRRSRRLAAALRRREGRRLSGLGSCAAHAQSRYGLLKSREEMLQ